MKFQLGIIGCGQLGQMLAQAALRMNMNVCFLSLDAFPVVAGLGRIYSLEEVNAFIKDCDRITVEKEAIPEAILALACGAGKLAPSLTALNSLRHRDQQKMLFDRLGLPTASWQKIENSTDLSAALLNWPDEHVRVKQILGGYDGLGQWRIHRSATQPIDNRCYPVILEREIKVDAELSMLIARNRHGDVIHYPAIENHMSNGILNWSFAPAPIDDTLEKQMFDCAAAIAHAVDYVGVMALEFFVSEGKLLINEVAPRVHNTGHWTLNACNCDQFEQHIRAICDLPLIEPNMDQAAALYNLLDNRLPKVIPNEPVRMYLHSYGKSVRQGRKLGHITLVAPDLNSVREAANNLL